VIVIDTHVWIWWVDANPKLPAKFQAYLQAHEADGLGVSIISVWEVAKLVEKQRLMLQVPVEDWINRALVFPGIRLLDLTPRISVEATQLPDSFHRDPADQIIVATARVYNCPLVTVDGSIRSYPHVLIAP
jgi:PIN domain nuclease of toxin-antitoxin system